MTDASGKGEYGSFRFTIEDLTASMGAAPSGGAGDPPVAIPGARNAGGAAQPRQKTAVELEAERAQRQPAEVAERSGSVASQIASAIGGPRAAGAVSGVQQFAALGNGLPAGTPPVYPGVASAAGAAAIAGGIVTGGVVALAVAGLKMFTEAIASAVKSLIAFHDFMVAEATRLAGFSGRAASSVARAQVAEVARTARSADARGGAAAAALDSDVRFQDATARLGDRLLPAWSSGVTVLTELLTATVNGVNVIIGLQQQYLAVAAKGTEAVVNTIADGMGPLGVGIKMSVAELKAAGNHLGVIASNTKPGADMQRGNEMFKKDIRAMGGHW